MSTVRFRKQRQFDSCWPQKAEKQSSCQQLPLRSAWRPLLLVAACPLPLATTSTTSAPWARPDRGARGAMPPSRPRRSPSLVRSKALADLEAQERACTNCGPLQAGYPSRAWARPAQRPADTRRRAAWRPGGPRRRALRRTGRADAGTGPERAGVDRRTVFVTNAVKHFKWEPRGKRRIHQKPRWSEIRACRPWLDAELALIAAPVVVALGQPPDRRSWVPTSALPRRWDRSNQNPAAEPSSPRTIRRRSCALPATTGIGCSTNSPRISGGPGRPLPSVLALNERHAMARCCWGVSHTWEHSGHRK